MWTDIKEKSKQLKYVEDPENIERSRGLKRKRSSKIQENKVKKKSEKREEEESSKKSDPAAVKNNVFAESCEVKVLNSRVAWSSLLNRMQQNAIAQDKASQRPTTNNRTIPFQNRPGIKCKEVFFYKVIASKS